MRNFVNSILANEQLSFALAVAFSLHILVIFGVSFTADNNNSTRQSLDVTIAMFEDETAPTKADFLAQANQQGSGTLDDKAIPTVQDKSELQDILAEDDFVALPQLSPEVQNTAQVITAHTKNSFEQISKNETTEEQSPLLLNGKWHELVAQVSNLEASIAKERQEYAARPRVLRLHSAATMTAKEALYVDAWRRKIEQIGNNNYPAEASRRKIYGKVMFKIVIAKDGRLLAADVVQSSGFNVLDQAVAKIAHLAAPFAPFGHELKSFDRLELVRTFCFSPGNKMQDCDKR